jgi:hypothetical protein
MKPLRLRDKRGIPFRTRRLIIHLTITKVDAGHVSVPWYHPYLRACSYHGKREGVKKMAKNNDSADYELVFDDDPVNETSQEAVADDEVITVHGIQYLDFTTNDGKQIKGVKVHGLCKGYGVTGHKAVSVFLGAHIPAPSDLKLGDRIEVYYNSKAKPCRVSRV